MPPLSSSGRFIFSAAGFMATSALGRPPGGEARLTHGIKSAVKPSGGAPDTSSLRRPELALPRLGEIAVLPGRAVEQALANPTARSPGSSSLRAARVEHLPRTALAGRD